MHIKYHLENRETLNTLINKIFDVLERLVIKEQMERTCNNLSQSIPDSIELDKQLILFKESECILNDVKLELLVLMQKVIEINDSQIEKLDTEL